MVLPRSVHYYTLQEYYALERAAEYKSEYFDGEIFPLGGIVGMAGGTSRHSLISMNLSGCLVLALRGKRCAAYNSDQRVKVKSTGLCTYPDASVFCGRLEYDLDDEQKETATNPTAVFEVLSESTEARRPRSSAALSHCRLMCSSPSTRRTLSTSDVGKMVAGC